LGRISYAFVATAGRYSPTQKMSDMGRKPTLQNLVLSCANDSPPSIENGRKATDQSNEETNQTDRKKHTKVQVNGQQYRAEATESQQDRSRTIKERPKPFISLI